VAGVQRRPQSPEHVGERPVRPKVHVVDRRLLINQVTVHRGRGDAVSRKRLENRSDLGSEHSEVTRRDRASWPNDLNANRAPLTEGGRDAPAVHRHRSGDQDSGHLGDRALSPATKAERAEHQRRIDRDGLREPRSHGPRRFCEGKHSVEPDRQVQRIALRVEMHIGDLRYFAHQVVVDRRHPDRGSALDGLSCAP